ncbi:hypothetical protein J6590_079581 [Homalodisca vitripennis]|nr:hypothetical protein J6590_079581 [Homalodisca vitripennis]
MHQNIRRLAKKLDRLNHSKHNLTIHINTYRTWIEHREGHKLGGVAIYTKDSANISANAIKISQFCTKFVCEAAMVQIKEKRNRVVNILGVYRPPSGSVEAAVQIIGNILETTQIQDKSIVIIGDINIDRLIDTTENRKLDEELSTQNIIRLPLPATRITTSTAMSIDMISTNIQENRIDFTVFEAGMSDHTRQICIIDFNLNMNPTQTQTHRRNFCKQNLDALKADAFTKKTGKKFTPNKM